MAVTTTINPQAEVPSRAAADMAAALSGQALTGNPSLADMLDERNAVVARLNAAGDDGDPADFKRTSALEAAIVAAPCRSIEDAAAKATLFETIDGEGLMWTDNAPWEVVVEIAPFLRSAAAERSLLASIKSGPHLSADLAALLPEFEVRYARERSATTAEAENDEPTRHREIGRAANEAIEETADVVRQIMATPATSLDDFRAKARMIDWAIGGSDGWDDGSEPVIFRPLVRQLVNELLGHAPVPVAPASAALLAAE